MQNEARWGSLDVYVQQKLEQAKAAVGANPIRKVRCPRCHFPLLEVSGFEHYFIRVKCRKCKFEELIDTAEFRTASTGNEHKA